MLETAQKRYPELRFAKCNLPDGLDALPKVDLVFANACLQWVPDHPHLLPRLMEQLNPGGALAVQMPIVQEARFYRAMDAVVAEEPWQKLQQVRNFHNLLPGQTYDILAACTPEIEMWDTTYYHLVDSHEAILDWYGGSGLRPYLAKLTEAEQPLFRARLREMLTEQFPVQADGRILLKMPRLFLIAKKRR